MMIAAGEAGRPGVGLAVGAGMEILGVEFVEAGTGQAQVSGCGASADLAGAITVEEMTDERRGQTFEQLSFFIGPKITEERWIYRIGTDSGRGRPGGDFAPPSLPYVRLQTALRLRPRRALSSAEAAGEFRQLRPRGNRPGPLFRF
jgi:hypothetical protein